VTAELIRTPDLLALWSFAAAFDCQRVMMASIHMFRTPRLTIINSPLETLDSLSGAFDLAKPGIERATKSPLLTRN